MVLKLFPGDPILDPPISGTPYKKKCDRGFLIRGGRFLLGGLDYHICLHWPLPNHPNVGIYGSPMECLGIMFRPNPLLLCRSTRGSTTHLLWLNLCGSKSILPAAQMNEHATRLRSTGSNQSPTRWFENRCCDASRDMGGTH